MMAVQLSAREREVLSLAAHGERIKTIAWKLTVTPRTVRYFLQSAAQKVGANSLREAVYKAAVGGLLEDAPECPSCGCKIKREAA